MCRSTLLMNSPPYIMLRLRTILNLLTCTLLFTSGKAIWFSSRDNAAIWFNESYHEETMLRNFSQTVVNEYFLNDKCVVVVTDDELLSSVLGMSVSYILISHETICDQPELVDEMLFAIEWLCSSYLIHVVNPVCVLNAWKEAQLAYDTPTNQRINPKMFILINNKFAFETLDDLLDQPEVEVIPNMVVAVSNQTNQEWPVDIYTTNFYVRISTPHREPKLLINRWNYERGFEAEVDLYMDKVLDLQGKEIKVCVVDLLPYASMSPFSGHEAEITKTFCAHHNCTIGAATDEFFWGDIFENGTGGNGLVGLVYTGEADFGISGFYLWGEYYRHVGFSAPYMESGVTLLVAAPARMGGWLVPFLPFSTDMWCAYIASVGATAVLMYLITRATIKYTRFGDDVMRRGMFLTPVDAVFRSLGLSVLQQPSTPIVPQTPIRHLFTSFELIYLVLSAIYAAELASYLTAPQYSKPIDTLHELAASGLIWVAEHCAYVYSLKGIDDPIIKAIVNNFRVEPFERQREMAMTGKYGLILERLAGGHFTRRDYLHETLVARSHTMAEYLYRSPLVAVIHKVSPYAHYYNKLIGRVLANGLLLYWEADSSREFMSSRMITALDRSRKLNTEDEARPLALTDTIGIFVLYLGGITISCLVLIGEILIRQNSQSLPGHNI